MPLIQGGPPEWIWERTPERLKWELVASEHRTARLSMNCG